jgi:hypothetical protein
MKKVRSEEVQSNIPPEFLFRIATKINVANRATIDALIIYFLHNALPANCKRCCHNRNTVKESKPNSERYLRELNCTD